jgi:hypothetical protein
VLAATTALSSDPLSPSLDLGTEPELDASLTQVDDRLWHVVVPALVLKHGVAVGESEDVSDALCVEKILGSDAWRHASHPTFVGGGSVRADR